MTLMLSLHLNNGTHFKHDDGIVGEILEAFLDKMLRWAYTSPNRAILLVPPHKGLQLYICIV